MRKSLKKIFSVRKKGKKDTKAALSKNTLPLQEITKVESSKAAATIQNESVATTSRSSTATAESRKESAMTEKPDEKSADTLLGSSAGKVKSQSSGDKKKAQTSHSVKTEETDEALHLVKSYDEIPVLEQTKLPRGGVSVETAAVGRVQVRRGSLFCMCVRFKPTFSSRLPCALLF